MPALLSYGGERVFPQLSVQEEDRMLTRKYLFSALMSLLIISALFIACSTKPSERRSKADLQESFEIKWPGLISIVEYQKIRGEGNDKSYAIYYRAQARFIKDTQGCVQTCCGDVCFDKLINGFRWVSKASDNPHVVHKGDLFEVQGKRTYKKTDKGWTRED